MTAALGERYIFGRNSYPILPADYALLRAALGHQRDDSQISLFWLSREGRTALQVRAMEGGSQV